MITVEGDAISVAPNIAVGVHTIMLTVTDNDGAASATAAGARSWARVAPGGR